MYSGNVDEQFRQIIKDVLANGTLKEDRTGTGTKSVFGRMMRLNLRDGFPLVTLKRTAFKAMLHECLWMLDSVPETYRERGFGPSNIKYLVDNGVKIWNEWPHKHYTQNCKDMRYMHVYDTVVYMGDTAVGGYRPYNLEEYAAKVKESDEFALAWGGLGPVYGQQWRYWGAGVDQIENAIEQLKSNPDSRRIMVSAWNPADLPTQLLPPCHYAFQYWTRPLSFEERVKLYDKKHAAFNVIQRIQADPEQAIEIGEDFADEMTAAGVPKRGLSIMFQMRSVDLVLGMPFDIASYATQLLMVAHVVGMQPEEVIVCSGDTHVYWNHFKDVAQFIDNPGKELPTLKINTAVRGIRDFRAEDFELVGYEPHPAVKFAVAV